MQNKVTLAILLLFVFLGTYLKSTTIIGKTQRRNLNGSSISAALSVLFFLSIIISALVFNILVSAELDTLCDEVEFSITPIEERIQSRSFPSVFQAWAPIWTEDRSHWDRLRDPELVPYHDLVFNDWIIYEGGERIDFHLTAEELPYGLAERFIIDSDWVKNRQRYYHTANANFVYLSAWTFFAEYLEAFPDDPKYWFSFAGNRVKYDAGRRYIVNLLNPEVQEVLIKQIVAKAACGVFDGIMVDQFTYDAMRIAGELPPAKAKAVQEAVIHIFREIRSRARADFLILVNAGAGRDSWLRSFTEYINGNFMECVREPGKPYDLEALKEIEDSLTWHEENLRYPQINCLEGFGFGTEPPNSPLNQKWMRVFTTLSLTHSDGYVLYNRGGFEIGEEPHAHYWYDFWDADLGQPVGGNETKAVFYENAEGLFIREFTNGWAVYNRSGAPQTVTLPAMATGVESDHRGITHTVPDLDGEIYLKMPTLTADVNNDGVVNILDLVVVAGALGNPDGPDLNGDGTVNILDLILVAQRIGE